MQENKISAVIVAHNEEKKLEDCLKSLDFVDEIVVVLDKCNDKSKEIALAQGAKIIEGSWNIEGARRNVALKNASCDWILEIDADERISRSLAAEIIAATKSGQPCGFEVPIANYVGKRWVKFGWLRTICVLKRQTLTYKGLKHYDEDKEIHPTFNANFAVKKLKEPLIHLVDDDITDLIARFNKYTSWKARDMAFSGKIKGGFFRLLFGAKIRFFKSYIVKKGFKEGSLGLLIAILCALYPIISYIKAKNANC
jgi:glycosyltransferase involved in cell wall biosynthesis